MDGKFALRSSQLCIQDGVWQSQAANLYIENASTRLRESRGSLYILLEMTYARPAPPALCSEIIRTISDSYGSVSGSITRGLRSALLAANALLFQRNVRADGEQRVLLGINCVLIRDQDAYVAQVGPALLGLAHNGVLTRYPESSAWLRSDSPGVLDLNREPAAGLRAEIEPNLSHVWLEPGDVLILASTALARMAPAAELVQAVSATGSDAIRANLETLADGRDLSIIVIECQTADQAASVARGTPRGHESPTVRPAQASAPASLPPLDASPAPAVRSSKAAPARADRAQAEPPPPPPHEPAPRIAADTGEDERAAGSLDSLRHGAKQARQRTADWLMRVLPDAVPDPPPARAAEPREPRQGPSETARTAEQREPRQRPSETARDAETVRPSRSPRPKASAPAPEPAPRAERVRAMPISGRALLVLALLIPLVVLALVVLTRVRYDRTRNSQFDTLKVQAQASYSAALNLPDVGQMRVGLYNALALAEDGLSVQPADETLSSLARRIQHKLNEIDVVQPLFHFWKLTDLDDLNTADAARIVVQGSDVFVLNRGSDRVYHYQLNDVGDALQPVDREPVLVQKGETRGGIQMGDLVDIAWLEAGGSRSIDTFVTLERSGTLLAYNPQQGIDALPVADSDMWLMPQAIASYFGNLYVLDPLVGRIFKYIPTDNAYTNPPGDYLANELATDLTGAVDMVIDGNLYVLFADGKIVKYLQGEVRPFQMASLPTPMRSPMAMFVSGAKEPDAPGYVYVADTGNDRIVQFDKAGNYMRQFRAQAGEVQLSQVRGLYVDETRGRIFFVSGSTLWLADIPPLSGS